jgi:hypothetical protein
MPLDPGSFGIAPAKAGMPAGAVYVSHATSAFHSLPPPPSRHSLRPCVVPGKPAAWCRLEAFVVDWPNEGVP